MKKFISLILIITTVFSLCSCSYTGSNTKITLGVPESISVLDPVKASNNGEKIVSANCFEGLLRLDANGGIDLGGAVRYSVSADGLSYTFKLNENAQWYIPSETKKILKGTDYSLTVTAEDYVFGIKRFIDSSNALDCIKGASSYSLKKDSKIGLTAENDSTLVITLEKADVDFLYKLATLPVYPCSKAIYEALGNKYCSSADYTVSNGAYFVKENSSVETVIERSRVYYGNLQVANRYVSLYTTGSVETMIKRFQNGTYDLYLAPSTMYLQGSTPCYRSIDCVWGFAFNTESDIGKNSVIRNILLSSICYDSISIPFFGVTATDHIIPDCYLTNSLFYSHKNFKVNKYTYDTESAIDSLNRLTDEMGYTTYTVDFAVPASMEESARSIIVNWEKAFGDSFLFNLILFDVSDTQTISEEGTYDLAFLPLSPERRTALGMLESLSSAPCRYTEAPLPQAYENFSSEYDIASEFNKAENHIISNGIFIPFCTASYDIYCNSGLTGIYSANGGSIIYLHGGIKAEEK